MEVGPCPVLLERRFGIVRPDPHQFGNDIFPVLAAARPEIFDSRQGNGNVVTGKAEHAGCHEIRRVMHQRAFFQPQQYGVGVVGTKELPFFGGHRQRLPAFAFGIHEHPRQLIAIIAAFIDTDGQIFAYIVEFAHAHLGTERT